MGVTKRMRRTETPNNRTAMSKHTSKKPCSISDLSTSIAPSSHLVLSQHTMRRFDTWRYQLQSDSTISQAPVPCTPRNGVVSLVASVTTLDKFHASQTQIVPTCSEKDVSTYDLTLIPQNSPSKEYTCKRLHRAPSTEQLLEPIEQESSEQLNHIDDEASTGRPPVTVRFKSESSGLYPAPTNVACTTKTHEPDACSIDSPTRIVIARDAQFASPASNDGFHGNEMDGLGDFENSDENLITLDTSRGHEIVRGRLISNAIENLKQCHSSTSQLSDSLITDDLFTYGEFVPSNSNAEMPISIAKNMAKQRTNSENFSGPPSPCRGEIYSELIRKNIRPEVQARMHCEQSIYADSHNSAARDEAPPPIVRPRFPLPVLDRSPLLHVSSATVLKTCFRVGEALNVGAYFVRRSSTRSSSGILLELYARVVESHRPETRHHERQEFVLGDLWSDKSPKLRGEWTGWKGSKVFAREAENLLTSGPPSHTWDQLRMCRAVGGLKREGREWIFKILSVWQCDWDDIIAVKHVVCGV